MFRKIAWAALLAIGEISFGSALAQENIDCKNAVESPEMRYCAAQAYEKADKELNALWPKVKLAAEASDKEAGNKSISKGLLASQRAWLAYVNAECELERLDWAGGTGEGMAVDQCRARLTQERNILLKERLAK